MKWFSHTLILAVTMFLFPMNASAEAAAPPEDKAADRQSEDSGQTEKDQPEKDKEDQETKRAVQRALWAAKAVPENAISVSVDDGSVKLEGRVDSMIVRQRAARVARSTRGVLGVSNLIMVNKSNIPDTKIGANVIQALADDPVADAWDDVVAQVDDGVVTLKGNVESYAEKLAAGDIVMNVKGVRDIRNEIRTSTIDVDDDALKERIENRLAWNSWIDADSIEVGVHNGKVDLAGSVDSAYEQRLAWQNAWIPGVKQVSVDTLKVTRQSESESKPSAGTAALGDTEIEKAVRQALGLNPRVRAFKPDVSVKRNVVTLSGTVGNLKARNAAAQTAFNIEGVRKVVNDIRVEPARAPGEEELERRISRAWSRDAILEPVDDLQVKVEGSVATVTGKPDSYFEKMQALDAVAKTDGVTAIDDRTTVDYRIPAITYVYDWNPIAYDFGFDYPMTDGRTDTEIAREIAAELRWSPYVDSDDVKVSVHEGVATLNGEVDSWSEYNAAMENALDGGASRVINRLNVEGSS
jgi:osmotically-inducible protein OsmY